MRTAIIALAAATLAVTGCAESYGPGPRHGPPPPAWRTYDYNRPDPAYGGYDASRYYRPGTQYRERQLRQNERIYRGSDGRYYCRRDDGTTGLIVGAIAGGVLGNVITRGDSEVLGTVLGAIAGGLIGREIDRSDVRCR
jgi:hypothetical protein